jgi:hypothetical protein
MRTLTLHETIKLPSSDCMLGQRQANFLQEGGCMRIHLDLAVYARYYDLVNYIGAARGQGRACMPGGEIHQSAGFLPIITGVSKLSGKT